ncbi:paraquat-inducible protein A [Pseudoalteromonas sp. KJ10-2]|uniref:paraquat-inducible protein A n=1 Tax=Psychromonas sp. KJ10-2 TaxID=3391822 RepID=UPI0039B5AC93
MSERPALTKGYVAKCSRCQHTLYKAKVANEKKILALALSALLLAVPAFSFSLVSVHLLGVTEQTSLLQGALLLIGFAPIVALVVIFCAVVAPALLAACMCFSSACVVLNKRPPLLNPVLKLTSVLIHWSMLEVYIVSFMVALFKLSSYADIYYDSGLFFLVALLILNMSMICEYSNAYYWSFLTNE